MPPLTNHIHTAQLGSAHHTHLLHAGQRVPIERLIAEAALLLPSPHLVLRLGRLLVLLDCLFELDVGILLLLVGRGVREENFLQLLDLRTQLQGTESCVRAANTRGARIRIDLTTRIRMHTPDTHTAYTGAHITHMTKCDNSTHFELPAGRPVPPCCDCMRFWGMEASFSNSESKSSSLLSFDISCCEGGA